MATVLYKDGESVRVEFDMLQNHLDAGWCLSKEVQPKVEEPIEEEESEVEEMSKEKTVDELRLEAKAAKIRGAHLMGEEKLRERLGYVNKD